MKKQTLSVVIAAKNEEKNIIRCLDSVKWADEIIIIDNGSADKTFELCKKYTNKIYYYPHNVLIPEIQNQGIKKATSEWVLILDADVVVPEKTKNEILQKIQSFDYDGYYLYHKNYHFGKFMKAGPGGVIMKLFRRTKGEFNCESAHCLIDIKGNLGKIRNPLLHYAHPTIATYIRKCNKYTSQDSKIIFERKKGGLLGKKLGKINLYHLLIEPFLYTFYVYFLNKSYKDGMHGLITSVLFGYYLFLERAKVWELQYKSKLKINYKTKR